MVPSFRALSLAVFLTASTVGGAVEAAPKAEKTVKAPSAADLADQALNAYEAGDFPAAIGLYSRSFALSGDARTLYNVASIYDKKLHDRDQAEAFYRRYLKSTTTEPELVTKVTDRLLEFERDRNRELQAERDRRREEEKPAKPTEPEKKPLPLKTIAFAAGGAGVVGLVLGSVFGISALSKASDLHTQCPNDVCRTNSGPGLRDDASTAATLSTVFVIAGSVLVAGAAALYYYTTRPPPKSSVALGKL